jgi:hypothetical protein
MVLFSCFKAYFMIDLVIQYQSAKVLADSSGGYSRFNIDRACLSVLYQVAVLLLRFANARHSFSYRSYDKKSRQSALNRYTLSMTAPQQTGDKINLHHLSAILSGTRARNLLLSWIPKLNSPQRLGDGN